MKNIRLVVNNEFKKDKQKFFIKNELRCILNLYAKMVSNGNWKDYSFTSGSKEISFDVYQRSSENYFSRDISATSSGRVIVCALAASSWWPAALCSGSSRNLAAGVPHSGGTH